jgi:serine/threonine protein kinase
MEKCGQTLDTLCLPVLEKTKIKNQIVEFVQFIYSKKIAHRDLHVGNICWDGSHIKIIDWEYIIDHRPDDLLAHYDLTGKGEVSPVGTGCMHVFSNHSKSVLTWLSPVKLSINDFLY